VCSSDLGDVVIGTTGKTLNQWIQEDPAVAGELRTMLPAALNGTGELPWQSPEHYFEFYDVNGHAVQYENGQVKTTSGNVMVGGKEYQDSSGNTVTQADAISKWNKAYESNPTGMEDYFKDSDGKIMDHPDMKRFLDDQHTDVVNVDPNTGGKVVAPMDDNSILRRTTAGDTYSKALDGIVSNYTQGGLVPGAASTVPGHSGDGSDIPKNSLLMYKSDGSYSVVQTSDSRFRTLLDSFSQNFYGGQPITQAQFEGIWGNGQGWIVDDGGHVMNFTKGTQEKYGLTPSTDDTNPSDYKIPGGNMAIVAGNKLSDSSPVSKIIAAVWKHGFHDPVQDPDTGQKLFRSNISSDAVFDAGAGDHLTDIIASKGQSFTENISGVDTTFKISAWTPDPSGTSGWLRVAQLDENGGTVGYRDIQIHQVG
jgi:hypothetical protein